MIMNNLIGPTSKASNCEEDKFFALLNNINKMLLDFGECTDGTEENGQIIPISIDTTEKENATGMLDTIVFDPLFGETDLSFVDSESILNSSSIICRKLIEMTPCDDCHSTLQETPIDSVANDIIFPSSNFTKHFEKVFLAVNVAIPHFCHEKSVRKKIISQVESAQEYPIGCEEHCKELALKLKELTTNSSLTSFCNTVNNTLSGKITELPAGCDHIQVKAFEFRQKKLHIGKHSDKFLG